MVLSFATRGHRGAQFGESTTRTWGGSSFGPPGTPIGASIVSVTRGQGVAVDVSVSALADEHVPHIIQACADWNELAQPGHPSGGPAAQQSCGARSPRPRDHTSPPTTPSCSPPPRLAHAPSLWVNAPCTASTGATGARKSASASGGPPAACAPGLRTTSNGRKAPARAVSGVGDC